MKNKIINVDSILELNCIETNYWAIINFFKRFTPDWYISRNIYFEQHHIYPRSEVNCEIPIVVNLPYKYHFLAHYYRAVESTDYRVKLLNYNACQVMIGKNKNVEYIKSCFPEEFYKMKAFIINNPSYTKKVINLETKQIFNTTKEAAMYFGVNYHYIIKACKEQDEYYEKSCYKTKYVSYYDETKPLSYYDDLLEHYKSIPRRKKKVWSDVDLKKRALSNTGNKFVQSKSKKVIDLNTNIVYDSTTKAGETTGIDRHKILLSCREKREVLMRNKKCNFRYVDDN